MEIPLESGDAETVFTDPGQDHTFRQAEAHLPGLQVGNHDNLFPRQDLRIRIAGTDPAEDLPQPAFS